MNASDSQGSTIAPKPIGPGRFVLVVGPSGAGKDTLIAGAKTSCSDDPTIVFLRRVVTRPANDAEDHDSLNDAAFNRAINDGAFSFWWNAHGLKYGIPRTADDDVRAGRTVVCNVSRGIVADVRTRYARVDVVLVTAPADVLTARLAGRSRDTDGSLMERIKRSDAFADFQANHVIENISAPGAAVQQLLGVINGKISLSKI
jgi:ribose 1,5-bisphosphokinase